MKIEAPCFSASIRIGKLESWKSGAERILSKSSANSEVSFRRYQLSKSVAVAVVAAGAVSGDGGVVLGASCWALGKDTGCGDGGMLGEDFRG